PSTDSAIYTLSLHDALPIYALHVEANANSAFDPLETARQAARHRVENAAHDEPRALTAFFIGLKSRGTALAVQRRVNEYRNEPLDRKSTRLNFQSPYDLVCR